VSARVRDEVANGTIPIVAEDWPTFLYEDNVYDPNELDKGLLRGYFLLRVSFLFNCKLFLNSRLGIPPYLHGPSNRAFSQNPDEFQVPCK